MPLCDARYDVLIGPSNGAAVADGPRHRAVVDMAEVRLADDWGDPGPLLDAQLLRWWSPWVRSMTYAPAVGSRRGKTLWVDGSPRRVRADRRYLRWAVPEADPPPHDDPDWVLPP